MIPDAAIIGAGHGAQLGTSVAGLERLHQFPAMREQTVLHVDARQRGGKLAQIGRRRPDETAHLPERPVRGCNRRFAVGKEQAQPLGFFGRGDDANGAGFDSPRSRGLGPRAHCIIKVGERQVALVVGPGEPFGRDAADALAARDIDLVARGRIAGEGAG
jgi:hypothetical protein